MKKYLFKCMTCKTIMTIESDLPKENISESPACPCSKALMLSMSSYEYAYGPMELPQQRNKWNE